MLDRRSPRAEGSRRIPALLPAAAAAALLLASLATPGLAGPPAPTPPPPRALVVVERVLAQDQGDWQVDYCLKNAGKDPLVLAPSDFQVRVGAWLSNSRVVAHATPRRAECSIDGRSGPAGFAEVIPSADEAVRCRERVVLRAWSGPACDAPAARTGDASPLAAVRVEAGGHLRLRLRFEHQHCLYGDYDPLLGRRELEIKLGAATVADALPLDREQYLARPRDTWDEPAEEHKDTRHFVSGPDSLHLEADVPGNGYYRFPARKVRYSTPMRLRFWYMIAPGTDGEVRAQVMQYREGPIWRPLTDGNVNLTLKGAGRWTRFEKIIRTESEATLLALEFKIVGGDMGEVWIDDVALEPADVAAGGP